MYINIKPILEERNKSVYWLAKEVGVRYQTINDLANNKTSAISFEIMELVCDALECQPNDIFILEKKKME